MECDVAEGAAYLNSCSAAKKGAQDMAFSPLFLHSTPLPRYSPPSLSVSDFRGDYVDKLSLRLVHQRL